MMPQMKVAIAREEDALGGAGEDALLLESLNAITSEQNESPNAE